VNIQMRAVAVLLAMVAAVSFVLRAAETLPAKLQIVALSTDPDLVTGGDVLLRVDVPAGVSPSAVRVRAGTRDVTPAFQRTAPHALTGLVTALAAGRTTIEAIAGMARASLDVTNYPITGPVISGPWQQPFICQTAAFALPDGSMLGAPLDANCSAPTVVQYVYRKAGAPMPDPAATAAARAAGPPAFFPLPSLTAPPPDVATTTTAAGEKVNFIVRVETGTMNRGIYQNAILHDPTVEGPPTPLTPPRGWNRRLIALHGSGCPGGWYVQGAAMGANILDVARLGEGYALFINTLNHPTNSCNAVVAGETAMIGKEHFIETFGVPDYTISTGGSGGAYTSLQIADALPGLIDGVSIRATFPDALSIALSGIDAHLLFRYFEASGGFSEAQKVAVSGYQGMKAFIDAANQSQRTDPVPNRTAMPGYQPARWNATVPESARYDPQRHPRGARPTIFDAARNVYGVDAATGAALRPFDNVGVQYGLAALNARVITVDQFLDLNERIGGFDRDANHTPGRSVGDAGAIKRAYQAGLTLGANGGLTSIPIFDNATSNEAGGYHYGWFHFALRERLRQATGGRGDNMVMWRSVGDGAAAQELFDRWMVAYTRDTSSAPRRVKVVRARPAQATDGCFDRATPPRFAADPLPFTRERDSRCSELYPVYSFPRKEAGGPLAANILKCQLKPVRAADYAVPFTDAQLGRLGALFPSGVCDWSKPGVNQVPVVPWASLGPSPKNAIATF
jgi:hypothetical protein